MVDYYWVRVCQAKKREEGVLVREQSYVPRYRSLLLHGRAQGKSVQITGARYGRKDGERSTETTG